MFTIQTGPFTGTTFTADQAYLIPANAAQGEIADKAGINPTALHQHFLRVFSPLEGWAVQVSGELIKLDMFPLPRNGLPAIEPVPCAEFKSSLINPQGMPVATASTVWTIGGPQDWERGETNARLRLYDALGLQTRFTVPVGAIDVPKAGETAMPEQFSVKRPVSNTDTPTVSSEVGSAGDVMSTSDDAMPFFEPFIDEDDEKRAAAVDAVPVYATRSEPVVATPEATPAVAKAPVTRASATVIQMRSKTSGKQKRERLPDDAPAPEALLNQAKTTARMYGKTLPENCTTKGEVNAFMKSLAG